MSMKNVKTYGLRLCVGVLTISVSLLPIQATEAVPVPPQKPDLYADLGVEQTKVSLVDGVPVPDMKPILDIEPAAGPSFKAPKALNLTTLLIPEIFKAKTDTKLVRKTEQFAHGYKPLSSQQSKLYAKIFNLQMHGKWDIADSKITEVTDTRLMGHVLYQRYMHAEYKSSFAELRDWMDQYADHPYADKIYKLAISKKGDDSAPLHEAVKTRELAQIKEPTIYYGKRYVGKVERNKAQNRSVRDLARKVKVLVRTGKTQEAQDHVIASTVTSVMDTVEIDQLKSVIAAGYLYRGQISKAQVIAAEAANRSGKFVPEAAWIAGLAFWQKDDFANAARYFEIVGASSYASGWRASAGHYWAARSYSRLGHKEKLRTSLASAAKHTHTFYGLIAQKIMGKRFIFNWEKPAFTQDDEARILASNAGRRAYSLVAAGQYALAEDELLRLNYKGDMDLRRSVLAYAVRVGLPAVAMRLGNMVANDGGQYYDSALYPNTPWEPKDGFVVDPALVHAVMRQESRFNQHAKSYSGALGLMQLMPKTADYIAKKTGYAGHVNAVTLADPATNMTVGQDYLEYLIKGRYVKGDIVSLLVAYNAGPGNLLKWRKRRGDVSDPLLFIETLPVQETRDYVAKVMSNYWMYRLRAGLDVPSLASLAGGQTPRYALQTTTMPDTYKVSSQ